MIGAIAGDIIGSVHEFKPTKSMEFPLFAPGSSFTDDTVLTVALADSIMSGVPYRDKLVEYYRHYPDAGYGGKFVRWASQGGGEPYRSYGNGSAMRVSPVAFAYDDLATVLQAAEASARPTHDHPEGIKGAEATAAAIFLTRQGMDKDELRRFIEREFRYDLSRTVAEMRPGYSFDVSCQGTVPAALRCYIDANDYEETVRLAISLGGDSDTIACIAGGIAQAAYGVPAEIEQEALRRLDQRLRGVVRQFRERYGC